MKITAEAQAYIEQVMQRKNTKLMRFYSMSNCCGTNIGITLQQEPEPGDGVIQIDGLTIAIPSSLKASLESLTLNIERIGSEPSLVLQGDLADNCY